MDLALPKSGKPAPQFTRVTKHLRNANGIPIVEASDNPILDMHMYEVKYADEKKSALFTNLIAENMFAHKDEEGNCHVLIEKITDHQFDDAAVKSQDMFVTTLSRIKRRRQTTQVLSLVLVTVIR